MQSQTNDVTVQSVARDYIHRTKHWSDREFEIEVLAEKDGLIVMDAVHADDISGKKGSNKSVQLQIDPFRMIVVKELAYQ